MWKFKVFTKRPSILFFYPPAPEPPAMLQCSPVPNDPLSYTCNWTTPVETNGELTGYELTCVPGLEEIPSPPVLTVTPSTTSATVSSLRNGVSYTCRVRARNEGGLSLASMPTSFYTTEIGTLSNNVL